MKRAAFFNQDPERLERVFGRGRRERLERLVDLYPHVVTSENFADHADRLRDLEVIFSTWGMVPMGAGELARLPALQAVFYAAGTVQSFARPLLRRGILLVSSWAANAVPVAEFSLAQILLSCKGYFRNTRSLLSPALRRRAPRGPGAFGETVGIIGAGMVGRRVCRLLRPFELKVIAHDPYLEDEEAARLGVEKVELDAVFARSCVVSNHLPDLPATRGMLDRRLFAGMREGATFINTGRGAQVVEEDLIGVLRERPDLTALLDVTDPEPPLEGSEFYTLPNVHLSSHIAGSQGDEILRQADYAIAEFENWAAGRPLRYRVTLEMLKTMA